MLSVYRISFCFFFKQKTAYEMRISDWSSDVCSSDLERLIRLFLSQSPAGLIVVGIDQTEAAATLLRAGALPIVQIMELGPQPFAMMLGFSQLHTGLSMKEPLLSHVFSRIPFLVARPDSLLNRRILTSHSSMCDGAPPQTPSRSPTKH